MDLTEHRTKITEQIDTSVTDIKIQKLELEIDILRDELLTLVSRTETAFAKLRKKVNKLGEYKDIDTHNKQMREVLEKIEKMENSSNNDMTIDGINNLMSDFADSHSNVVDTDRKKYPEKPMDDFAGGNDEIWDRMASMSR